MELRLLGQLRRWQQAVEQPLQDVHTHPIAHHLHQLPLTDVWLDPLRRVGIQEHHLIPFKAPPTACHPVAPCSCTSACKAWTDILHPVHVGAVEVGNHVDIEWLIAVLHELLDGLEEIALGRLLGCRRKTCSQCCCAVLLQRVQDGLNSSVPD